MNPRPAVEPRGEPAPAEHDDGELAPAAIAVDTHCHLFLMEEDPAEVVAAARAAGVGRLVCAGIDPDSSRRSLELAESFPGVFATAGVHPHDAASFDRAAGRVVEELLGDPLVVGVGETGLDYYRRLSPEQDQRRAFRAQIALAREAGRPLVVHVRDAWEDALAILAAERAERVVVHCFSGDEEIARECAARGYYLSFAANVTYPSARHLRAAAAIAPEDRLLIETDSPYLPPQSMRGTPNRPSNVLAVARALADARGREVDEIVRLTAAAAAAAFPFGR